MGFILVVIWLGSVIAGWVVAAERSGNSIGCLWAVILFIMGPLAPIVFVLYLTLGQDNRER